MATSTAQRVRNRRGSGALLRQEILDAALEILQEKGDESAVSVRAVAGRVGITAPSIYDHFASMGVLIAEVIQEVYRRYEEALRASVVGVTAPKDRLRRSLAACLRFAREHPEQYRLLFVRWNTSAMPEVRQNAMQLFVEMAAELAKITGNRDHEASTKGAMWLWVEVHGIASLRPSHPHFPWPPEAELVSDLIERAVWSSSPSRP